MSKKILILGAKGMLGGYLANVFSDMNPVLWDKEDLDITDSDAVSEKITRLNPDIIINSAAYTAVDDCEKNRELAYKVNGEAVKYLFEASNKVGAIFIHYSTDYVFDGKNPNGYREDDEPHNQVNAYGESKLLGENHIFDVIASSALGGHPSVLGGHPSVVIASEVPMSRLWRETGSRLPMFRRGRKSECRDDEQSRQFGSGIASSFATLTSRNDGVVCHCEERSDEAISRNNNIRFYLIRTSWLYGKNGKNFVDTMLKLAETQKEIKVVNNQHGKPTYALDLAKRTRELLEKNYESGIYHITNETENIQIGITWYDFAKEIFSAVNKKIELTPCASDEFPRPAKRPEWSALANTKMPIARDWKDALKELLINDIGVIIQNKEINKKMGNE